jgi:ribonuclease VapC
MIALDTSALMAMVMDEADAGAIQRVLESANEFCISAATIVEAHIVSWRRKVGGEMDALIANIAPEIVHVTNEFASAANLAHDAYGRGVHPAALNFGDCFAYALAKSRGCALLYVGEGFAQTDVRSAL